MKHIDYKASSKTERTSSEWLRVGSQIGELANGWAVRTDIVTFIGEGATDDVVAALFKPAIAEIEISVDKAFGFGVTPETIGDIRESSTRYEFPRATGAILHEAMHARFSRWDIAKAYADLESDEMSALLLLEEGRIERQAMSLDSKYRTFLRASALELALGEVDVEELSDLTVALTVQLLGLVQARVIAGVLTADEVAEIVQIIRVKLGENAFLRLSEIADEFQQYGNHWSIEGAYPLAKEWAKIIRDLQQEQGEESEGEGEGGSSMSQELSDLLDALNEAADEVAIKNLSEIYDQQEAEEWEQEVKEKKSKSKEQLENKDVSSEIFSKGTTETGMTGTFSTLELKRDPMAAERRAAVIVARMLEKAKYRERDVTVVTSDLPQGKFRSRAAITNAALREQGSLPTANEWKRKVRKQTDEPTLNVGVMVDISGSMRPAMEAMATTAWVMSEAVRRVQGKAAMVYYGQDVFPTLKAGQHLDGVQVWTANDPTEQFNKAFKALDGSLNLLYGNGARLLVVVSDGCYTSEETSKAKKWMKRCQENGVAVLWLTFGSVYEKDAQRICEGTHAVVLSGRLDPADAAVEIGKAAARALEMTNKASA